MLLWKYTCKCLATKKTFDGRGNNDLLKTENKIMNSFIDA